MVLPKIKKPEFRLKPENPMPGYIPLIFSRSSEAFALKYKDNHE